MMKPQFVGILLCTLLGATLGNRMRCYNCGGGPSNSCKGTVTICGEGERCGFLERKPQPGLGQIKLSENLFRTFQVQSGSGQMVPLLEKSSLYPFWLLALNT
ncbi:Lymphocyte antigen 6 complex locus protein G6d [Sciurus carolinensis]|uniref:Lymphocyte antigen 6 complex locus protein G6d n=1 Tax=Sciurus carolinensis TaxID=30640 RepID=A0AA41SVU5_SCICA|nr:Lymphocyte antigen 6 complex locus protein G6d [Sciurus carolinensis]